MADRSDWLEWRRGGLGSSDVAAVLGASPYASPWDVWLSKVEDIDGGDSASMERGRYLEPAVARWAADLLGAPMKPGEPLTHPEHDWMRATPDFWLLVLGVLVLLEVKTARAITEEWGEAGSDVVPALYYLQVQWQMAVAGTDRAYLVVFFLVNDEFRLYEIPADPAMQAHMVRECGRWWQAHVVANEPPPIDGTSGARTWLDAHAKSTKVEAEATDTQAADADLLRALRDQRKTIEAEEARVRNRLIASMGECTDLIGDFGRVTYRKHTSRRVNLARLREEHPDIADNLTETSEYAKFSTYWRKTQ